MKVIAIIACLLAFASGVMSENITKPHTFTSGTAAKADEVNTNFDVLYNQVNKNTESITRASAILGGNVGFGVKTNGVTYSALPWFTGTSEQEIKRHMPFPRDGTVRSFHLQINENDLTKGQYTATVRKNGVDTDIQITVEAGQTGTFSNTNSVSFSAGDIGTLKHEFSSIPSGQSMYGFSVVWIFEY